MRLYVINVGVNSSDAQKYQLRSPRFPDGTFEFVPICESERFGGVTTIPRYCDLPSWTGKGGSLANFVPESQRKARVHHDPDFEFFTYGDIPSSRAAALREVIPGDQLLFLARLWQHDGTRFLGDSGFYFVGKFVVEANLHFKNGNGQCVPMLLPRLKPNAHWLRQEAGDSGTFRILFGNHDGSRRFQRALEVTPGVAAHLFASSYDAKTDGFVAKGNVSHNKNGKPRRWRYFGSITRTVQWFLDSNEPTHSPYLNALHSLARNAGTATSASIRQSSGRGLECQRCP